MGGEGVTSLAMMHLCMLDMSLGINLIQNPLRASSSGMARKVRRVIEHLSLPKDVHYQDVVFHKAKLLEYCCVFKKHNKKDKFQHNQSAIGDDNVRRMEPRKAKNHDDPVAMLPESDEGPLHEKPTNHSKNRAVNVGG